MFLFTFNLYTQINLFIKHIFTNKFITTPYYIYGGVLLGAWWCPGVLVVPGAWWLVVLPGDPRWLVSVQWSSLMAAIGGVVLGGWWCSLVAGGAPW